MLLTHVRSGPAPEQLARVAAGGVAQGARRVGGAAAEEGLRCAVLDVRHRHVTQEARHSEAAHVRRSPHQRKEVGARGRGATHLASEAARIYYAASSAKGGGCLKLWPGARDGGAGARAVTAVVASCAMPGGEASRPICRAVLASRCRITCALQVRRRDVALRCHVRHGAAGACAGSPNPRPRRSHTAVRVGRDAHTTHTAGEDRGRVSPR